MRSEANSKLIHSIIEDYLDETFDFEKDLSEEDKDKLYEEIKYNFGLSITYNDAMKEIEDYLKNQRDKYNLIFEKLKNSGYISDFVLNNYNNIDNAKIDKFIEFLKDKGFYLINKEKLREYIYNIKIEEENVPYNPEELVTDADEEFRKYFLQIFEIIDKKRNNYGVNQDKFKNIILKTLKVSENEFDNLKYDFRTKKYTFLKEIAFQEKDIEPYYIVKYYNIETGKIYYSIYYEDNIIIENFIKTEKEAYDKASQLAKGIIPNLLEKNSNELENKNINEKDTNLAEIEFEDEEIKKDKEFITNTIKNIHKDREKKLNRRGNKRFIAFKIAGWIMALTIILIPFSLLIFISLKANNTLRGDVDNSPQVFIKIVRLIGWIFTFSLILSPLGIPLVMLSYISENVEQKYKVDNS